MKKTLALTVLFTLPAFAGNYSPEQARTISEALSHALKKVVVDGQVVNYKTYVDLRGKSDKGLPCAVDISLFPTDVQIDVMEVKKESDLDANGIPTTRSGQFRWKDYHDNFKKQNVKAFRVFPNSVLLDFEYRDFGGPMGHASDAKTIINFTDADGLQSVYAKENRGWFSSSAQYEATCSGPWKVHGHD